MDGYSTVNYVFTVDDTFATPMARECRGLKFDADGKLIARPFHKFFNLGEKGAPQAEPWDSPHVVMEKLDGSMVHPVLLGGELVFMTRMNRSVQADAALAVASAGVRSLCEDMIHAGFTPIFEFTGPENRIVVAYDTPQSTLLAVRDMRTGLYLPHVDIEVLGAKYDVPVVGTHGTVEDVMAFWNATRAMEEGEGFVIAFEDGHRLKIKTEAYALRHKALSGLAHEKNVLAWVAKGAVDDVLPLLAPEAADIVRAYQSQVLGRAQALAAEVEAFVAANADADRRAFAGRVQTDLAPELRPVAFKALDGVPPMQMILSVLERAAGSENKVEAIRPLFHMTWTPPDAAD